MNNFIKSALFGLGTLILSTALAPNVANAWGHLGHQTIAEVASQIVPLKGAFWAANSTQMGVLTNVPDVVWKSGLSASKEKPNHWFQIDSYFANPQQFSLFPQIYVEATKKYTEVKVITNGTAPWRIKQFYDLAVAAFKKQDYATGLQMAGAMSHYVGDLSQPLHVSKNYDGQETGDPGIHKFYETTNIDSHASNLSGEVTDLAKKLLADKNFVNQFNGSVADNAFQEINRAIAEKDSLIATDKKLGRGTQGADTLFEHAKLRLADGAATLALILERLSQDAGLTNTGASIKVTIPAWIAPQFARVKKKGFYHSDVNDLMEYINGNDCVE